jgi:hypothetical protein
MTPEEEASVSGPRRKSFAVDAVSLSWEGLLAYEFPPFGFYGPVFQKMTRLSCKILVIGPNKHVVHQPSVTDYPNIPDKN